MNYINEPLKATIMRRVHRVYRMRQVFSLVSAKPLWLLGLTGILAKLVSIADVLKNRPAFNDFGSNYAFWSSAFLHTATTVQITLVLLAAVSIFFAKDLIKLSLRGDLSLYRV